MKRVVEIKAGLEDLLGQKVCIFCSVYIYTGTLQGANSDHVELEGAKIVYETGALDSGEWKIAESLPGLWRVQKSAIESWGEAKC